MGLGAALAKEGFTNAEQQEVNAWLSTGYPVLDHRISGKYHGGGIPQGRIGEIAGPESAGKTALVTGAMASAQKLGGVAIFQDHEKSFDIGLAKARFGLSDDPDHWVYNKPRTYEESWDQVKDILYIARGITADKKGVLSMGTALVPLEIPIIAVFDSLASMTPQSKFIKAAEKQGMNDKLALGSATSMTFDVMSTIAEMANVTMVFLNQLREDPTVTHGDNKKTPGGKAPAYYYSWRARLARSILYDEKTKTKYGQTIRCELLKNKTYRPFQKCEWEFLFQEDGTGKFDLVGGVIEELKLLGILKMSGAYIEWLDGKKYHKGPLVKKIEEEGLYPTLLDLLPKDIEAKSE